MPAKLLVADDSTTIQKVFERTFPAEEFSLSFANNGEEALAKTKAERPQLIIADTNMPLKNGFEVCEMIKNDPTLKDIPVLLLIGILDDFDEDASRRVGADGYIVKPFEVNTAIGKVREALSKGQNTAPAARTVAGQTAEIMELADIIKKMPTMPPVPPQRQGAEEILELKDIIQTTPAMSPVPPQRQGAEEILELKDAIKKSSSFPPPPHQEKKQEEEFVLQSPLRELEAELKSEFPEEKEGGLESSLSQEEKGESLGLKLDLPFDEIEFETPPKDVDWTGLFGDLSGDLDIEASGQELKGERLETILGESATELEKIEGLGLMKDEPMKEAFSRKFREPFFGEKSPKSEEIASLGPTKREKGEEEFAEKFLDEFEPVFEESIAKAEKSAAIGLKQDQPKKKQEYPENFDDFEPVFEEEDDFQRIEILDKDLKGLADDDKGDVVERVASALSRELKEVVENVIKNKVPKLVHEILEQSKKE